MKKYLYILFILLSSCKYFTPKEEIITDTIVAQVEEQKLYKEDILKLLPNNLNGKDSLIFAKRIIDNWATQQILLKKAIQNTTEKDNQEIVDLVNNYRNSLLINSYKEKLINQQLDTIVSENLITDYYNNNRSNFRLNDELIQLKYLHFGKDVVNQKELIELFKSKNVEDIEELEKQQLSFKSISLNDSTWYRLDNILLKLPFSRSELLKNSKYNKKEDSLGVYLVAVKSVLKRNEISPMQYIYSNIKQIILHKRKLELIRDIEKSILQDAIKNKEFIIN